MAEKAILRTTRHGKILPPITQITVNVIAHRILSTPIYISHYVPSIVLPVCHAHHVDNIDKIASK